MTREEYLRYGLEIQLLKFSEYLELTKPLNLPEGLEEAADKYAHSLGYDEEKERLEIASAKEDFIAGAEWGAGRGITITTDEPSNKTLEKVAAAMWSLVHSGVDKIIIQIREK